MGNNESKNANDWVKIGGEKTRIPGNPYSVKNKLGTRGELYEIEVPKQKNVDKYLDEYDKRVSSLSGHLVTVKDAEEK